LDGSRGEPLPAYLQAIGLGVEELIDIEFLFGSAGIHCKSGDVSIFLGVCENGGYLQREGAVGASCEGDEDFLKCSIAAAVLENDNIARGLLDDRIDRRTDVEDICRPLPVLS
jgi:hypothetical protein